MAKTIFIAGLTFLIDQFSKWYIVFYMDLETRLAINVLPPVLNLRMGWNEGINFGLFANYSDITRWILIGIAVTAAIGILLFSRKYTGWIAAILFGSVIGGALGNALDRVLYGAVADFLNMSCCGIRNPFVFNIADIFVFTGIFGFLLFSEKLSKRA